MAKIVFDPNSGMTITDKKTKVEFKWVPPEEYTFLLRKHYNQEYISEPIEFESDNFYLTVGGDDAVHIDTFCKDSRTSDNIDVICSTIRPEPYADVDKDSPIIVSLNGKDHMISITRRFYHQFPEGLTVRQLIEQLSKLDPNYIIGVGTTADCGYINAGGDINDILVYADNGYVQLWSEE